MNKINILCVVFALFFVAACVPATTTLKQHKVRIVDAETGAPVADAVIDLHYFPSAPEAPDPNHPRATANAQGEITIQSRAEPAIWQVQAEGYIEQQLTGNEGALPPRYAASATGDYDGVIHLYQTPEPQLTILVSDTYTGPLTINLQPAPGFDYVLVDEINVAFAAVDPQASYVQEAAGTRVFTATASAEGVVDLVVAPLLYEIEARQLQIRDSTGVLPYRDIANPQDTERGVWGNVSEDDKRLHHQIRLFVGTLDGYQEFLNP
ncbi:MAG: hypothetical protein ACE5LU_06510 [Anaerolineae bacterium]